MTVGSSEATTTLIELHGETYEAVEVRWNDPLCVEMRQQKHEEISRLYPQFKEPDNAPSESDCLVFIVIAVRTPSRELRPLAAGGLRRVDDARAEVKRMFVVPEARGRGLGTPKAVNLGQEIVRLLEKRAKSMRFTTLVLETGDYMDRARRFYQRCGFEETEPYYPNGLYDLDSVFYAKTIE